MDNVTEDVVNKLYKFKHQMIYSSVMKLLKTYNLNTHFFGSKKRLEHGYYEFGSKKNHVLILIVLMQHLMKYYV